MGVSSRIYDPARLSISPSVQSVESQPLDICEAVL
jgi:hypothetical protein